MTTWLQLNYSQWIPTLCRKQSGPHGSLGSWEWSDTGGGEGGLESQPWEKQSYLKQRRQNRVLYEWRAFDRFSGSMLGLLGICIIN